MMLTALVHVSAPTLPDLMASLKKFLKIICAEIAVLKLKFSSEVCTASIA